MLQRLIHKHFLQNKILESRRHRLLARFRFAHFISGLVPDLEMRPMPSIKTSLVRPVASRNSGEISSRPVASISASMALPRKIRFHH
jgi:hypothetical protein